MVCTYIFSCLCSQFATKLQNYRITVVRVQLGLLCSSLRVLIEDKVPSPLLLSQQAQTVIQTWGGVARRLCRREGLGSVGQHSDEHEPAECPGNQEGQQDPGLNQK